MRRSREVPLTLLASLAFTVTACRDQPRNCVDGNNRLLPASACRAGSSGAFVPGAHYVYGGSSGGHVGDTVVGSSVTRGGFGGFGGSHGAGGE
ncbi:MAG: hypothetical protein ACLGSD_02210 [Acidobacteriota bacterium]